MYTYTKLNLILYSIIQLKLYYTTIYILNLPKTIHYNKTILYYNTDINRDEGSENDSEESETDNTGDPEKVQEEEDESTVNILTITKQ